MQKYKDIFITLSIELSLREYDLTEQALISKASSPEDLIIALYSHPKILHRGTDPHLPGEEPMLHFFLFSMLLFQIFTNW
jgi:hypothetical protein